MFRLFGGEGYNAMRTNSPTAYVVQYLHEIKSFPLLEATEEASLARRWLESADRQAVHRIITSHLRLVISVARRYRRMALHSRSKGGLAIG